MTMRNLTVALLWALTAGPILAAEEPASKPAFPDTPDNRRLVADAFVEYQQIAETRGRVVKVNGIDMHYLEWGDERGVPLIWSHGYTSTAFEMISVAPRLVELGYHVYAVTYRGHGQTQVTDLEFSLSHVADDIDQMMQTLGIERAVIGGLSLGGGVTTSFYDHYPDRALALVLEDGGADPVQARTERLYPQLKAMGQRGLPDENLVFDDRFSGFQAIADRYLPGWGNKMPDGIAPAFHSWIVELTDGKFALHYNGPELMGMGSATIDPSRSNELPLLGQSWRRIHPAITYRRLEVPMLVINPTGDLFDPSDDFEKLRAMHPTLITVVEYPDTPHAAHPMRPDWFVRDMASLLGRVQKRD